MCLYTKMICPQKARKDIICYKIVKKKKHKTGDKKYRTPCQNYPIRFHQLIKAKEETIRAEKYTGVSILLQDLYIVEEGYIHCCTTIEHAKNWIKANYMLFVHNRKQPYRWAIIRCVIHKGTLYYKSHTGLEICAKQIFTRGIELES